MVEQAERELERSVQEPDIPEKCAHCSFFDKEFDPLNQETHFYCWAPWWHPKRWSCSLPPGVMRA